MEYSGEKIMEILQKKEGISKRHIKIFFENDTSVLQKIEQIILLWETSEIGIQIGKIEHGQ